MCLIILAVDKKPDMEIVRRAFLDNDDGASITWVNDKRKVEYIKGITTAEEVYNLSLATELPFVIHFRKTSTGLKTDPLLTHPFEISKDSPLKLYGETDRVLIHNGTEVDWRKCLAASGLTIPKDKAGLPQDMSDTRAIAMILSQHKNNDFLFAATGKFVVVGYGSPTDERAFRYYGDFQEDDGILYSNLLWKWSKTYGFYGEEYDAGSGSYNFHLHKKKDETQKIPTIPKETEKEYPVLRQPYSFSPKTDRYKYLKWWKFQSGATGLAANYSVKYPPVQLPPNTITYKLKPPILPKLTPSQEEQEFFGGSGAERFNRGDFY